MCCCVVSGDQRACKQTAANTVLPNLAPRITAFIQDFDIEDDGDFF